MKQLRTQRRIASQLLKCGLNRIRFDSANLKEIKQAITKSDIRALIDKGMVKKMHIKGKSRYGSRKIRIQKSKGRRKGPGSRKGKFTARNRKKRSWINKIRAQRKFLKSLHNKKDITSIIYRTLYQKSKGGFFRSVRHIKLYLEEHGILKLKEPIKNEKETKVNLQAEKTK